MHVFLNSLHIAGREKKIDFSSWSLGFLSDQNNIFFPCLLEDSRDFGSLGEKALFFQKGGNDSCFM